jgi:hypothetical protein
LAENPKETLDSQILKEEPFTVYLTPSCFLGGEKAEDTKTEGAVTPEHLSRQTYTINAEISDAVFMVRKKENEPYEEQNEIYSVEGVPLLRITALYKADGAGSGADAGGRCPPAKSGKVTGTYSIPFADAQTIERIFDEAGVLRKNCAPLRARKKERHGWNKKHYSKGKGQAEAADYESGFMEDPEKGLDPWKISALELIGREIRLYRERINGREIMGVAFTGVDLQRERKEHMYDLE